jgi:DNA-binding MarR family transcriptional regulator
LFGCVDVGIALLSFNQGNKQLRWNVVAILHSYAKLRELLFQIEVDLGIEELTETERKVLAALARLSGGTNCDVQLDEIRQDAIITDIPAPSLYRAFSALQKQGYIGRSGGQRSGLYHLSERALD